MSHLLELPLLTQLLEGPAIILILVVIVGFILFVYFIPVGLWIAALASGAGVGIFQLIGMRFRRVNPKAIVIPRISAVKAGLNISTNALEAHYLAGGNVQMVINSLISAGKAGIHAF